MKKIFLFVILIAFVGVLGWQIYQKATASKKGFRRQREKIPVAVEILPVEKTSIRDVGRFTGTLRPRSQFRVAPKIAGRLEKVFFDIGDRIKKGDLIAVLDDDEYLQQADQVRAELEVTLANTEESKSLLEIAKRELDRTVALRKKKIASESELDAAESQFKKQQVKLKVAEAQVAQKKAALKASKVRLSYAKIRVDWEVDSGYRVVGERFVDEGAMLAPNTPIVSILDIGVLTAVIHVIERDYPKVRVGQEAVITSDAYPGRQFFGKVVRLAPLMKETSRQARVEIAIINKNQLLKPGMFARVLIEFEKRDAVTVVTPVAIVKRGGKQGVFVPIEQKGTVRFVPVTIGVANEDQVEIVSPLKAKNVVTVGQHLLEDGSSILLPGKVQSRKNSKKINKEGVIRGVIKNSDKKK